MRYCFVVNPHAGSVRYDRVVSGILKEFRGCDTYFGSDAESALAALSRRREPAMIIAVGGDGTLNQVINTVAGTGIPVGILPLGSANDLARALEIPTDFKRACSIFKSPYWQDIDLVSVNGRCFATNGGLGFPAEVVAAVSQHRSGRARRAFKLLGQYTYALSALELLCRRWSPMYATVTTPDWGPEPFYGTLVVSNQPSFGALFCLSPASSNRDGVLEVTGIGTPPTRLHMVGILAGALAGGFAPAGVLATRRARSMVIQTMETCTFIGDGEALARGRSFQVQVIHSALRVAVPGTQAAGSLCGEDRRYGT